MIRTFIAIDLSPQVQSKLGDVITQLRGDNRLPVRWVPATNIHITLKFLGDVEERFLPVLQNAAAQAVSQFPVFHIRVEGVGVFPRIERPRIVWIGSSFDQVGMDLQSALEESLQSIGVEKEKRAFSPHLTIGRVSKDLSATETQMFAGVIRQNQNIRIGTVKVENIRLFRSDLLPGGAEYNVLMTFPLLK